MTLLCSFSHRQKTLLVLIAVVAVIVISTAFLNANANQIRSSVVGTIDESTYQAVHLDTGEIYFGKVTEANGEVVVLTDVFYFLDDTKTKLVKRGKEAHSSSDAFSINRDHVLATENLDADSPVVTAIQKYLENKN
jgi:hypothetical protein